MPNQADPESVSNAAPASGPTVGSPLLQLRPLHVFESWRPVVSGYTTRSWELVAAQRAAGGLEPRVLVSSRQTVYGASTVEPPPGLERYFRAVEPSVGEVHWRRLRRFHVDGRHLEQAIETAVADWGADLVHVHWSSILGRAAAEAAARLGLPLVAEVRFDLAGAMMSETVKLPLPPLERRLRDRFEAHLARAAAVIAASESLASLLRAANLVPADRLLVVPNGIDTERFAPAPSDPEARAALGLDGRFVVGTTSNMLRYEGLDLLIRALARAQTAGLPVHGLFVGGGPCDVELRRLAGQLGVPATFVGRVPAAQVPGWLRQMDLFVVPRRDLTITRFAGPIKLVEAMATGLPIVASGVGDIEPLLADGRGRLVAPGSVAGLAAALMELADQPGRRAAMGRLAREYALNRLLWSSAADRHREAYARALAGG